MKILILGGTGAIGSHVVNILAQRFAVTTTSRSQRDNVNNVTYIKGNAKDLVFAKEIAKQGWDIIIDFMNYSLKEFRFLYEIYASSTQHYIFLSSSRIFADTGKQLIDEDSPKLLHTESNDKEYLYSNEYGLTKAMQEDIIQTSSFANWTIIRPYITYSETRFQLGALEKEDWLQRALSGRSLVVQKSLLNKTTTLTYAHDVAEVIVAIALSKETIGKSYNVAAPRQYSLTWQQVLDIYSNAIKDITGKSCKVIYLTDEEFKTIRSSTALYQTSKDRMYNRTFNCNAISSFKDENTYMTPEEGLAACIKTFSIKPKYSFTNQAQEAKLDKISHEFTPLREIKGTKQKLIYLYYRLLKNY